MAKREDYLKEWYDTGKIDDNEQVVVSNMPDEFQTMRANSAPEQDVDDQQDIELSVEIEKETEEQPEETNETKALQDVFVKTGLFYDSLLKFHEALNRGDEPMQLDFLKERIKSMSVELMRLVDGI